MRYPEAIQFLYDLRLFGTKLGLENTFKLAEFAGNPQQCLRFIHVAGTNGKGSTCAMLESIYRTAGLKVGLFTSPHLVSFRERLQVNRNLIAEQEVVRLVQLAQGWLQKFAPANHPTFFEVVTIMAAKYFHEQGCDLVIWETGLGGRLDATNIVLPLASLITNVQLDHEKWLGSTVAQIAAEKAGIIKPGVPVLTAAEHPDARAVIRETCDRVGAPLTGVGEVELSDPVLQGIALPLMGEHQRINAALAVAAVRLLREHIPVPEDAIKRGLTRVGWPGRFQVGQTPDGRRAILDGAHNPAGAEALRQALHLYFPDEKPTFVLGVFQDKDWTTMCEILAPCAGRIVLAPVHSERTAAPNDLARVCERIAPGVAVLQCASLNDALQQVSRDAFVVITGSLHLVGEAMEILDLAPATANERSLNEWDGGARRNLRAATAVP